MIKFMFNNIKSGLVVLGLFLMVGILTLTFSFTTKTSTVPLIKTSQAWSYSPLATDPTDEENYTPFLGDINEFCQGEEDVCVVMATDRGDGYPDLTTNLLQQINKEITASDVYFKD